MTGFHTNHTEKPVEVSFSKTLPAVFFECHKIHIQLLFSFSL